MTATDEQLEDSTSSLFANASPPQTPTTKRKSNILLESNAKNVTITPPVAQANSFPKFQTAFEEDNYNTIEEMSGTSSISTNSANSSDSGGGNNSAGEVDVGVKLLELEQNLSQLREIIRTGAPYPKSPPNNNNLNVSVPETDKKQLPAPTTLASNASNVNVSVSNSTNAPVTTTTSNTKEENKKAKHHLPGYRSKSVFD